MGTLRGIGGVILHSEGLALSFRIVGDRELHRVQHHHGALGRGVEILPQAMLQKAVLHSVGGLSHADALAEIADGRGRVAAAAQTAQRRHARIVPAGDVALFAPAAQAA